MRYLMTTAAIAPALAALATGVAQAETTIATARTTPVLTSTATGTAADDVTISTAGSVTVTSGAAVTVDSNNKVANAGAIKITGADNATGILVRPGTTGAIDNSGSITLDEDYTATDTDSDGDIDGGFAQGTGRNGIWVQAGTAHAGAITHSGSITVEGMSAAGIRLDGALNGTLATSGTITVTGDNGHGVLANGVSGNITLRGSTSVVGANSVGAALLGDIGGALKIQGTIISTGYRSTTRPTDVTKLDADDLLQGGGAVKISGNVAGGIIFDTPPVVDSTNTSTDQDGDGLTDSTEGSAAIISYGSAAAVAIGATDRDIAIGAVGASGRGLIINGSISGTGIYDGVSGQGLVIGGLGGGVTITGGMNVNGGIYAYSVDSNATAVRLGSGARVDAIGIAGTVGASGSTLAGTSVRAVVIDSGATSGSIAVSGAVVAAALDSAKGSAIAILDSSGTVSSLSNSGRISASGGLTNVAIDMSANAGGVMLTQTLAKEGATAPSIIGDVRLGAGNDAVTLSAGSLTGNVALGAGNDSLSLAGASTLTGHVGFGAGTAALSLGGTAKLAGTVDFGGGTGTLTLGGTSVLAGTLANSGAIAVNLTGGTLDIASTGPVALASLDAGAGSTIGVRIDGTSDTNTVYTVAGSANFATGSLVKATLANVAGSAGDYVIVKAGSLSGTPALSGTGTLLPYMFKGSITSNAASGEVILSVAAKSVAELGLSGSTARAYAAIFNALDRDAAVASAYLAVADGATLDSALQQMLPDHAGGTFEAVTSGSRATARILSDPGGLYRSKDGRFGMWLTQVAYGSAKSVGSTASYDITGWGVSGGGEYLSDIGAFGASLAYLHGNDAGGGASHAVTSDQFELAAHWRGQWGPLQGFARVSAAQIDFAGERRFVLGNVSRIAQGDWSGRLYSATVGASYEARFGRISLRPAAGIDYYRLNEGSYAESGGGDAFNLTVDGRTSDETTANGTLTVAYDIGSLNRADGWARIELEGGRRQILSGSLGDTTAHFGDGDAFTLVAQDRTNGWTGRARLIGGTDSFRVGGEFSAEQQQNHIAIALRATVHFAL